MPTVKQGQPRFLNSPVVGANPIRWLERTVLLGALQGPADIAQLATATEVAQNQESSYPDNGFQL